VIGRLTGDTALHETMRQNGFRYVERTYRWPVVMARYGAFLEEFVGRRRREPTRTRREQRHGDEVEG
jgi:hypothetical protein